VLSFCCFRILQQVLEANRVSGAVCALITGEGDIGLECVYIFVLNILCSIVANKSGGVVFKLTE